MGTAAPWQGPVVGKLRSGFGLRRHPIRGDVRPHRGVDIAAAPGAPARAVRRGRVIYAGWRGDYGRVVELDHGLGWRSRYAHLSALAVHAGDRVESGDRVGAVGASGRVTGPHLHFEVDYHGTPIDPLALWR